MDALPVEYLPHICVAFSSLIAAYLIMSQCLWRSHVPAEADYAFSASTIVRRRSPTVLQFSAHVPPGSGVRPMILRMIGSESPSSIKEEDGPARPLPKSILTRSTSFSVPVEDAIQIDDDSPPSTPAPHPMPPVATVSRASSSVPSGSSAAIRSGSEHLQGMQASSTSSRQGHPKKTPTTKRITRSTSKASLSYSASQSTIPMKSNASADMVWFSCSLMIWLR
ncbi:hypothetical protein C8Q79DRAFT_1009405 [Trametes meyenii]|nr:hypothetical protein C8Q79DRAFT_1009405 [Trametes meyenii]